MNDSFIKEKVLLYKYTTLKVGGEAKYFAMISEVEDLEKIRRFASQTALSWFVFGGGSNILADDSGYEGLAIHNNIKGFQYKDIENDKVLLVCKSGEVLDEVIADTVRKGYWGLENLSAIPGTVGATPVQNVGAYGVEVKDLIKEVTCFNMLTGQTETFTNKDCDFGYRDSFFKTEKGKNYIILSVSFLLNKNPTPKLEYRDLKNKFNNVVVDQKDIREAVIKIRENKFPNWKKVGTAGSFFKNPIVSKETVDSLIEMYPGLPNYKMINGKFKLSLGYILDKICNLKGCKDGNVGLYSEQALVLVNYKEKNSKEIKRFADEIIKIVYEKTKIKITPEVFYLK
ncbi:MAG: UDP-N-acetylmuramate dehydrogenase [Candidatus Paceibacterota bacterium]